MGEPENMFSSQGVYQELLELRGGAGGCGGKRAEESKPS